jgi:Family of unknown function (DUF5407)
VETAGQAVLAQIPPGFVFLQGAAVPNGETAITFCNLPSNGCVDPATIPRDSCMSLGDMFELELLDNHLAALETEAGAVVPAANQAIASQCRNCKG